MYIIFTNMALNTTSEVALFFMTKNKPSEKNNHSITTSAHHDLPPTKNKLKLKESNHPRSHVTFSESKIKNRIHHDDEHSLHEESSSSDEDDIHSDNSDENDQDSFHEKNDDTSHHKTHGSSSSSSSINHKEQSHHQVEEQYYHKQKEKHLIQRLQDLEIKLSNLDAEWNTKLQTFKKEEYELTQAQFKSLSKEHDQKLSDAMKSMTSKLNETKHLTNQMKEVQDRLHINHNRFEHAFEDLIQDLKDESATNEEHFQHLERTIQQMQKQIQTYQNQQQQSKQSTNPIHHSLKERPTSSSSQQQQQAKQSSTPFHFSFPLFSSKSSSTHNTDSKDKDDIENDSVSQSKGNGGRSVSPIIRKARNTNPKSLTQQEQQQHSSTSQKIKKQTMRRSMSPSPITKATSHKPSESENESGPARNTRSQVQKRMATTAADMNDVLLNMTMNDTHQNLTNEEQEEKHEVYHFNKDENHQNEDDSCEITVVVNDHMPNSTTEMQSNDNIIPPPIHHHHHPNTNRLLMIHEKNQRKNNEDSSSSSSLLLEPCSDQSEGFHQLLMYIIQHLQSKTVQSHAELNEVVLALSDVAVLQYPTESMITIVSDRQASILRLISSFYQIVCLISMDEKITPEEVYANKDLMIQASHRVLAMHS